MKRFRYSLLLVLTLGFLGFHSQVSAQENTEETVTTELVDHVAEPKPSESIPPAVEDSQTDGAEHVASPTPLPEPPPVLENVETTEEEIEDEEDLPEFDLSDIDQVIDQLYPSATALEEDIIAKSEEDEAFKDYVGASLKTEALVSRYVEWQAQFSTDTEAPNIEAFLSGDIAQTEDFKAFVYKGIISDWLIGQYLNSLAEKAEHEATLEKKAVEEILSSQPTSEEELETYFYAKLYSDDKLKTYFYTNLKSDPLIRQYFEALDDEEGLLETFGEISPDDKRRLRAYFYQTLQRDGYFRSYFYQTTDRDGAGELSEGSHFFKSVPNIQPGDKRKKKSKPKAQPQPIAPPPPVYVPPKRPPYNTDGPISGQRNPILDQEAADHSPNGRTNISFQDLEKRGVPVSDKHYEVNAQYHRDSLERQIARGLEPNRYHYDSLNSYYNILREKRGVSPTPSSSYRPVASAQPGIGGFTAEEMANLEVKFLGRSNPTSSYSGSSYHSSSPSLSTSRPGVGGFSDEDVKRLMSKFDNLFTKPKTTSTSSISETTTKLINQANAGDHNAILTLAKQFDHTARDRSYKLTQAEIDASNARVWKNTQDSVVNIIGEVVGVYNFNRLVTGVDPVTGKPANRWSAGGELTVDLVSNLVPIAKIGKIGKVIDTVDDIHDASRIVNTVDNLNDSQKIIKVTTLDELPQNVQDAYRGYSGNNWQGTYKGQAVGTKAGKRFYNKEELLPKVDDYGNEIIYKEYDINSKILDERRDAERFVRGSDGSLYYSSNHYQAGSFLRIE